MPLRDHFHSPWQDEHYWEGFHSAWVNTMVRHLNGSLLPRQFRAVPQVHLGAWVEADVATFEKNGVAAGQESDDNRSGTATAVWAPPQPVQSFDVDFPNLDIFEVRVFDEQRGHRLVAAVELASPGNKDRPERVNAFTSKCAAYLEQHVGLIIVDVVTTRRVNFHKELAKLLSLEAPPDGFSDLYALALRTRPMEGKWRMDSWPARLVVGEKLPTLPLWLAADFAVPLDLERTYEETCGVLRID